ncbi:MAG: hypothetical protein J1F32_01665 [Erysipelotrichales bacterium]|nr:hypothetical protein [Erysipelotrichales bacterium]
MEASKVKKTKLITEDNITMTNCFNALKKLRNCPTCKFRYDKEKCKENRCVPQVVIEVMKTAVIIYFHDKKAEKKLSKQPIVVAEDKPVNNNPVDDLPF